MANALSLDIRLINVAAAAQTNLGGAVRCDITANGQVVSSAYYASVTAAMSAATSIVDTYTMVG